MNRKDNTGTNILNRYRIFKFKTLIILLFFFAITLQVLILIDLPLNEKLTTPTPSLAILHKPVVDALQAITPVRDKNVSIPLKIPSEIEFKMNWARNRINKLQKHTDKYNVMKLLNEVTPLTRPSTRIHIFYDSSYGNPELDGKWKLWNHEYRISKKSEDSNFKLKRKHEPPEDIASNFYPMLGCYSSRDSRVINIHMKQIHDAGIGVVVVSWNPNESKNSTNDTFAVILDTAMKYQLKVATHIEAQPQHTTEDLLLFLYYVMSSYISHPALYKLKRNGQYLPVYYVFKSYLTSSLIWRGILTGKGRKSVRGSPYDGVFIGMLSNQKDKYHIEKSLFDGFYTYFSSNGRFYGSTWKNWKTLQEFSAKHKLLFFPSVSPGYIDTNIGGKGSFTRDRSRGAYYQVAWRSAIAIKSFGISITSFNNWKEGTQIEPAISKHLTPFKYLDYEPEGPFYYLNLTRYYVKQFISTNILDET